MQYAADADHDRHDDNGGEVSFSGICQQIVGKERNAGQQQEHNAERIDKRGEQAFGQAVPALGGKDIGPVLLAHRMHLMAGKTIGRGVERLQGFVRLNAGGVKQAGCSLANQFRTDGM